jgi:hypothetical protein
MHGVLSQRLHAPPWHSAKAQGWLYLSSYRHQEQHGGSGFYLFISVYLTTFSVAKINSVEWWDDKWIKNWKESWRKRPWPNLRYCPGICLQGLRKTTRNLNQDSRSPQRDLNPGPLEYEAGVLISRPRSSVYIHFDT